MNIFAKFFYFSRKYFARLMNCTKYFRWFRGIGFDLFCIKFPLFCGLQDFARAKFHYRMFQIDNYRYRRIYFAQFTCAVSAGLHLQYAWHVLEALCLAM
jgi:hypothetical protein